MQKPNIRLEGGTHNAKWHPQPLECWLMTHNTGLSMTCGEVLASNHILTIGRSKRERTRVSRPQKKGEKERKNLRLIKIDGTVLKGYNIELCVEHFIHEESLTPLSEKQQNFRINL